MPKITKKNNNDDSHQVVDDKIVFNKFNNGDSSESEDEEEVIVKCESSFTIYRVKIAIKDGPLVSPMCLCKKVMVQKGRMHLVCANNACPLQIDYDAFHFFASHGYFRFENDNSDPDKPNLKSAIVDVPVCKSCCNKPGFLICLISYLSPKTVDYPAHKGITWRCYCKQSWRAGLNSLLSNGWRKFGPSIDGVSSKRKSLSDHNESDNKKAVFDFSSYKA